MRRHSARRCWTQRVLAATAVLIATCPGSSLAQDAVADFYRSKQLTIIAGGAPGGGSAPLYSQALARHMGRHLPGNPGFIVQYMPAASGMVAANFVYNNAPRDGTVFTHTPRNIVIEPLLDNANAKYDPPRFGWLGTANVETTICMNWHTSPVKTLQDALTRESVAGGAAQDATQAMWPKAANNLIGTKFKLVRGYHSAPAIMLAMERGEVESFCGIGWTFMKLRKAEWIAEKKINILFQIAGEKHPDLPDIPLMGDLIRGPADRQVYNFLLAPQEFGRPFFAPPEVPADRLAALRLAFERTLQDPAFLADAEKTGIEIQHRSGEAVAKTVHGLFFETSKDAIARARAIAQ
jgi:tripartite-type tricarboxylate transporter receptor subunit TctC